MSAGTERECLTLAAIYAVPRPFDSLEQYDRYFHHDLQRRTRAELRLELDRVRWRLEFDPFPDVWLTQRHDKLRRALGDAR